MKYEVFVKEIAGRLGTALGASGRVEYGSMTKNNGICKDTLTIIRKDDPLSPVIYPDELYRNLQAGVDMETICGEITRSVMSEERKPRIDLRFLSDWNIAKERIVCRLIGAEQNAGRLKELVHRKILDMAVVYYYMLETEEDVTAGVSIRNDCLSGWGITGDQLDRIARVNTRRLYPPVFAGMDQIMSEILQPAGNVSGIHIPDGDGKMSGFPREDMQEADRELLYVLTNSTRLNGAYWICDEKVQEDIRERIGDRYLILPSSIHECMIVPEDAQIDPVQAAVMVREINRDSVDPEEVLTDSVYRCERDRGLVMAV